MLIRLEPRRLGWYCIGCWSADEWRRQCWESEVLEHICWFAIKIIRWSNSGFAISVYISPFNLLYTFCIGSSSTCKLFHYGCGTMYSADVLELPTEESRISAVLPAGLRHCSSHAPAYSGTGHLRVWVVILTGPLVWCFITSCDYINRFILSRTI